MKRIDTTDQRRRWTGWAITSLVPVGLYSKYYAGPLADWVNHSLGGVFYVLLWCLVACWCLPRAVPWRIAWVVLVITCLLEFLQRWHPPFLEWLRSFWIGQILLGTTFAWSDFPYYFIGAGLGWLSMRVLHSPVANR